MLQCVELLMAEPYRLTTETTRAARLSCDLPPRKAIAKPHDDHMKRNSCAGAGVGSLPLSAPALLAAHPNVVGCQRRAEAVAIGPRERIPCAAVAGERREVDLRPVFAEEQHLEPQGLGVVVRRRRLPCGKAARRDALRGRGGVVGEAKAARAELAGGAAGWQAHMA